MTIQRHIGVHMSDDEMKLSHRQTIVAFRSPVPTQVVSMESTTLYPKRMTRKKVEGLIKELADVQAKRHNISRRQFLASSAGMATAVSGDEQGFRSDLGCFRGRGRHMEMSKYRASQLSRQFIFDDQPTSSAMTSSRKACLA